MWSKLTAVILAGGLGTRLRPAVVDRPKALAPVHDRPFLAHLLDQLAMAGVQRVVVCTGYLGEQVQAAFGRQYGPLALVYSHEPVPLGTAGAIRRALPLLDADPVLVLNGDSYCAVNLTAFLAWHRARRGQGSLVLTRVQETGRYGRVQVDDAGAVVSFAEKGPTPSGAATTPGWINAGLYLLSHDLLHSIPTTRSVSIERESFPAWVGRGLYGYRGGGRFLDIGTPEAYGEAQVFFADHHQRTTVERQREAIDDGRPAAARRVVLLDRDGTLNVERHYLSDPNGVELLPGVVEGLRRLRDLGLVLAVVTNQSAVARGYIDTTRLEAIHARLQDLLAQGGVGLDGIYVCPHRPEDGCQCRKPEPGLVQQAVGDLGFDPSEAFVIGDKGSDIALGRRVGATTLLVTTGYGPEALADPDVRPDFVVDSLTEAAEVITAIRSQKSEVRSQESGARSQKSEEGKGIGSAGMSLMR